mmetsp:Transcript_16113/g.46151  ORF Transcript_16113/g.46151 Transcript_16113/m.46151 type:complete len:298 (-) Transcript_16113:2311-3204(-)
MSSPSNSASSRASSSFVSSSSSSSPRSTGGDRDGASACMDGDGAATDSGTGSGGGTAESGSGSGIWSPNMSSSGSCASSKSSSSAKASSTTATSACSVSSITVTSSARASFSSKSVSSTATSASANMSSSPTAASTASASAKSVSYTSLSLLSYLAPREIGGWGSASGTDSSWSFRDMFAKTVSGEPSVRLRSFSNASSQPGNRFGYSFGLAKDSAALGLTFIKSACHMPTISVTLDGQYVLAKKAASGSLPHSMRRSTHPRTSPVMNLHVKAMFSFPCSCATRDRLCIPSTLPWAE